MQSITVWRTSTRSSHNGQCVEVGFGNERVAVRDTKNRTAGELTVAFEQWGEFVSRVKRGDFNS